MDDKILFAIIAATPAVIAAIFSGINMIRTAINVEKQNQKLHQIHVDINSRLTELIEASKDSGRIEERDAQMKRESNVKET